MLTSLYKYVAGITGFGVGTGNQAFQRPTTIPVNQFYSERYNVKGAINPQAPGYVKMGQSLVTVDLKGQGVYFAGDMALQQLSDFQKGLIP